MFLHLPGGGKMGGFSGKRPCPVCGGEVKGVLLTKIAGGQTLCSDCSLRVCMSEELLKIAMPEFIEEHLAYRQKNAERRSSLHWDREYNGIPGLWIGVDLKKRAFCLVHERLHDADNPVIFSFDQIIGYELYRRNKIVDDADTPGGTALESGSMSPGAGEGSDYFRIKLTTTESYWREMELEISFYADELYGYGGFGKEFREVCQLFKKLARRESVQEEKYLI